MKPNPNLFWEQVQKQYTVDLAVALVQKSYHLKNHLYFQWMRNPKTTRDGFRQSQVPFRYAAESHAQALAAVLAHIPHVDLRMKLARNVAYEHGMGKEQATNKGRFVGYLRQLGATDEEIALPCPVEVRAFAQSILNFALISPYEAGAAMVGIIEILFVSVSLMTKEAVLDREWITDGSELYSLHEESDLEHAQALLELAEPGWTAPRTRDNIAQGILLGAHWVWTLYNQLLPELEEA